MTSDPRIFLWAEACDMLERAERLRRQFFRPNFVAIHTGVAAPNWEPPIDIFETAASLSIVAALPGVEPQDLSVVLRSGNLNIEGQRRLPAAPGAAIHRLEIPHGRFERQVALPAGRFEIDQSVLSHGCLSITLKRLS
jgi:HSP20 family protein